MGYNKDQLPIRPEKDRRNKLTTQTRQVMTDEERMIINLAEEMGSPAIVDVRFAKALIEKGREEALRLVCHNFTEVIGNKILRGPSIKYTAFIDLWQKVERQVKEGKGV